MDPATRRPVKLGEGDDVRMAEFSPGVPPGVRAALRLDAAAATVPALIAGLSAAVPDPSAPISDLALDFCVANRDLLGLRMKKALTSLKLHHQSRADLPEARRYKALRDAYVLLENKISGPFRQMVLDGEGRIGPNFANLDVE
ncbi:hypothetical protein TeGR_g896, partial [Tetraparma gracilis]